MPTFVVWNQNGADITGVFELKGNEASLPTMTNPPGGVNNTGGTVRVVTTLTVLPDGRHTHTVNNKGH